MIHLLSIRNNLITRAVLGGAFTYPIGWVNLYQKILIVKYTVCGKLILAKKLKDI